MMDARRWQSPAAAAAAAEAAAEDASGGGGGPSRRPPRRGLQRASPYGLGPRRWLPKPPVASSVFPAASRDHAAEGDNRMGQYESMDVAHEASRVTHEVSRNKSMEPNTNAITNVALAFSNEANLLPEGDYINRSSGLAEIEKIIKQKQFSRDETERLIEIMRSRTPDLHEDDQRATQSFAKETETTPFSNKLVIPAKPDERNWGTDVFAQSNVHDVTSPIELARAYMEAQTSASVHESQKRKFRALSHGVEIENSASKIFPKVAMDSPVRWPGSVVRDHTNHYLTPQSNKRRALPPASSRSPYTGSVFRRSVKRTGQLDTYSNLSGRPQLSTPFSVGSKAMLEDKMTSTDGVLGVQPSTSSERVHADAVGTDTPHTFTLERPHGKGTIESGSSTGRVPVADNISKHAAVSVHPKSSQTAQKILQHLERTIPSPTVKPELRRTAKRTISPVVISSPYKMPDSVTNNAPRQNSLNEHASAYQAISNVKKVQEPPSSSNCEEPAPKVQSPVATPEVTEMTGSQHLSKPDAATAPAAAVSDKSATNGFMFSFPVTKTSVSLPEPPPTPTFFSPPKRSPPADIQDIPKFNFGSPSSTDNLVFSVDAAGGSAGAEEVAPTFKFGSDKRELSFDVAGKDAVVS
ncbi:hypothetical protein CFC21_098844 [Triticum aestivum]|uniref:Uncharacterized protein n=3 Tax=Triticum TaxID=4564 RepID=A0A9R0ZHP7_TRITD|nr:uncharacterized protein LOC123148208 isoform X1 [Triticum aestivum]KAF7096965.1 hypothetical protein CFC21_098844 [Triticum aestivum]VAI77986.1 unnamed protein product [Triticum turgidum subsp. durum]